MLTLITIITINKRLYSKILRRKQCNITNKQHRNIVFEIHNQSEIMHNLVFKVYY